MKTLVIGTHALLVFAWFGLASPPGSIAVEPLPSQQPAAPVPSTPRPRPNRPRRQTRSTACSRPSRSIRISFSRRCCSAPRIPAKSRRSTSGCASQTLKGSELQDAATKSGFEPSFVALVLFPQVVEAMAGRSRLDDAARPGVRRRSLGGLRQHPAAESQGAGCRQAEEHAAAGRRNQDHVEWRAGDRDRAGQPAGRLRAAVQPADRLHDVVVHRGRSGKQQQ